MFDVHVNNERKLRSVQVQVCTPIGRLSLRKDGMNKDPYMITMLDHPGHTSGP